MQITSVEWQFEEEIQKRVDNWVRWARSRKVEPVSCRSLEKRYKAPPMYEAPPLNTMIDTLDAPEVEAVIVSLPNKFKVIFIFAYIAPGYNFGAQCKKIGIPPRDYDDTLNRAKQMVQNILKKRLN